MVDKNMVRHPREALVLERAIAKGSEEIDIILNDLCTANSNRCQILQETFHDLNDPILWEKLFYYLANPWWSEKFHYFHPLDSQAKEKIDQAIVEIFIRDESDRERNEKVEVLLVNLGSPNNNFRYYAAYLLGLRGDPVCVPVLSEIIEKESKAWKLRSVKALSNVNNEDCAGPLMKALVSDRGKLHREARRALKNLGSSAESVWSKALKHTDSHIRWEAAHGLGQIGDSRAVLTLAEGLLDKNYVVRWTTANVLAQLGENGVRAILNIMVTNELNESLRQSTYHALNRITSSRLRKKLKPLLNVLSESTSCELASSIAKNLLIKWEESG